MKRFEKMTQAEFIAAKKKGHHKPLIEILERLAQRSERPYLLGRFAPALSDVSLDDKWCCRELSGMYNQGGMHHIERRKIKAHGARASWGYRLKAETIGEPVMSDFVASADAPEPARTTPGTVEDLFDRLDSMDEQLAWLVDKTADIMIKLIKLEPNSTEAESSESPPEEKTRIGWREFFDGMDKQR